MTCTFLVYGKYSDLPADDPMRVAGQYMTSAWVAFANTLHPNRPYCTFHSPAHLFPIANRCFGVSAYMAQVRKSSQHD